MDDGEGGSAVAACVATMGPAVGEALADLLEQEAGTLETADRAPGGGQEHVVALARRINTPKKREP